MKTKTKIVIAAAITAYLAVGVTMAFAGSPKEPYGQASFQKACDVYNGNGGSAYHCDARPNGIRISLNVLSRTMEREYWEPRCKKLLKWLKDGTQPGGDLVVTISSHYDSISCDNKPSED